jgi:PAS domain S-box-containing protein
MKISIESKVAGGFILALLIVAGFSVNAFFGMNSLIHENERYLQVSKIMKSADQVQYNLINAAASCREYIISDRDESFNTYISSIEKAEAVLRSLNERTGKENPEQNAELQRNFVLLKEKSKEIIRTKQMFDSNAAMAMMLDGDVAEYGNRLVSALQELRSSQRTKTLQGSKNDIAIANRTISSFALLVIAILIVLGIVYYLFKKDLAERKKIHEALDEMNETLEYKVKYRTEALIQGMKKYKFMTENVTDIISLHNRNGSYTYVSESCKYITGYETEEIIGCPGDYFIHPEDVENVRMAHHAILSGNPNSGAVNFRFLKKNGEYIWLESIANVVKDAAGAFESIIICSRDITERIKAEKALKEHQQMLQGILDNTDNIIFIKDLKGEYLLKNKEFESLRSTLGAQEKNNSFLTELLDLEKQRDAQIATANEKAEFELQLPVNGQIRDFSITKFPLYNDSKIYAICGIGTDITSHKKAQREITDSKAKLVALIQNSSDPIWSVNKDLQLIDYNNSCIDVMQKYFGANVSFRMNALEMTSSSFTVEWKANYLRALTGEYFSEEISLSKGTEEQYFDVSFNPVIVNDSVEGVAVFARDITSRKKTEKQLGYKVNELNTFMYKATHDLRSPLVSLMGLTRLAKEEASEECEQLSQYFDMIGTSVLKMDQLLVDLVGITNVSQGQLQVKQVDFTKMVADITDSLRHYPDFGTISIRKVINESNAFYNDEKLLYSIMQNLIDNAIKYRKNSEEVKSTISIMVECSGNSASINIIDNGTGIEEAYCDKVFDMFYRASTTAPGTGLGLYIVKTAVEKMKGKISLASKTSEGTSVYITLPDLSWMMKEEIKAGTALIQ